MKTKIRSHSAAQRNRGVTLIECLVYCSVLMILAATGIVLLGKMMGFHRDLERNANDITRSLNAGERWRADVRQATGPIRSFVEGESVLFEIPQETDSVLYQFDQHHLWRHTSSESPSWLALKDVSGCQFVLDSRSHTEAWRLEVHLKTKLKTVRVEPKFSFLAVPPPQPPTPLEAL